VLILPEGATRDDISEPHNLYPYLKEHASDWYQSVNAYSDIPLLQPNVNSSLFVITGTHRAKTWSLAEFPPNDSALVRPTVFRYIDNPEQGRSFDTSYGTSLSAFHEKGSNAKGRFPSTFFIRGISIALCKPIWTHNLAPIPVHDLPIYYVPSVPSCGRRADLEVFIQRLRGAPPIKKRTEVSGQTSVVGQPVTPTGLKVIFHPAIVLLQILLEVVRHQNCAIEALSNFLGSSS
jgi:hypothetical protein